MSCPFAIFLVGAVLCSPPAFAQDEPVGETFVDGKSLAQWVGELKNKNAKLRLDAVNAVAAILDLDQAALPPLLDAARDPDPRIRVAVAARLTRDLSNPVPQPIARTVTAMVSDPSAEVRRLAIIALRTIHGRLAFAQLLESSRDSDLKVRALADQSLSEIDSLPIECLPTLFAAWRSSDEQFEQSFAKLRARAFELCRKLELPADAMASICKRLLVDADVDVRCLALRSAGKYDAKESFILPALLQNLRDKNDALSAASIEGLSGLEPASDGCMPALVKLAADDNANIRLAAITALARATQATPPIRVPVADLLPRIQDSNSDVRIAAWTIVASAGSPDPKITQAWLDALRNPSGDIRLEACRQAKFLRNIDKSTRIDALVDRLHDDPPLRLAAARELAAFDPLGVRTVAVILNHLNTAPTKEIDLVDELPKFGDRGQKALCSLAGNNDPEVTRRIANSIDPKWTDGPDIARALVKNADPKTRAAAMQKSLNLPKDVVQSFAKDFAASLGDPDNDVSTAGWFCVRYVDPSPVILKALIGQLKAPTLEIRTRAANALIRFDNRSPGVNKALIDAAIIDNLDEAMRSIHLFGPDPRILPTLLTRVKHEELLSDTTINAIVRVGKTRDDVAEALAARAQQEKRGLGPADVRFRIVSALWWMGSSARKALPVLMDEATDPNPAIRRAAVAAIGHIGAEAKSALPLLEERLRDADPAVAAEAKRAIEWIR